MDCILWFFFVDYLIDKEEFFILCKENENFGGNFEIVLENIFVFRLKLLDKNKDIKIVKF